MQLKLMQYTIDSGHRNAKHVQAMNVMVRDFKVIGPDVSKEEHVLNVVRALLDDNEHARSFKVIMAHSANIKTFKAISKHLQIEEDCMKAYAPPNMAFFPSGSGPKGTPKGSRPYRGNKPKKSRHLSQNSCSKGCFAKKHMAKCNGAKDTTSAKCYNCEKKGHFGWDCLKPTKVLLSTKTHELYVCFHAFIANSRPQWIVDRGKQNT